MTILTDFRVSSRILSLGEKLENVRPHTLPVTTTPISEEVGHDHVHHFFAELAQKLTM